MIVTGERETGWYRPCRLALSLVSVLLLCVTSAPVLSAPTGADLKDACTEALASGFNGINGQMCTWYVLPCNCSAYKDIPLVCLPEGIPVSQLATGVIAGIVDYPELETQPAADAAAEILSRYYPCPA